MDRRRVVVTGLGVVTPVGSTIESFFGNIKAGKHGISTITAFDVSNYDIKLAAEVKDFDPLTYIEKKEARRMDKYSQFAVTAAAMAIEDAGTDFKSLDPFRVGVLISSGIGGITTIEAEHTKYIEKGPGRVGVFFVPMMIGNMAAGLIAIRFGFKGDNFDVVSACSSSNHAIGEAYRKIQHGYLDVCLAGGAESAISEFCMSGFNNMGALSDVTDPDRASIPFDAERKGFVMGEGAGVLVLEEYEHAVKRGAKIYAEVAGYGATDDAYHITAPDPEGGGAVRAMQNAFLDLSQLGLTPDDIGYINTHGTGTPVGDPIETTAIKRVFGERAYKIAVGSTKSMTGHLLGAAGAVEGIITVLSLKNGVIPPTVGLRCPDPACDLDYISDGARNIQVKAALSNSLGFGGHNASVAYSAMING